MRRPRSLLVALAASVPFCASYACTNAAPPASHAPARAALTMSAAPAPDASAPAPAACPADIGAFLRRHAALNGDADQVERELPLSFRGKLLDATALPVEVNLDATRYRLAVWAGHHVQASGIDETGGWTTGKSGVPVRSDDADDATWRSRLDAWMLRRGYLRESPLGIECVSSDGSIRGLVYVHYGVAAPARVDVAFDIATAELRGLFLTSAAGRRVLRHWIGSWGPRDGNGVRWPTERMYGHDGVQLDAPIAGLQCPTAGTTAERCLTAIQTVEITWPPSRRVALPMATTENEIVVRARVGGHLRSVLFDSGASVSGGIVAAAIAPSFTADGPSAGFTTVRGPIEERLGYVDRIDFGPLVVQHLPAFLHPMNFWKPTDASRPSMLVGSTLFDAAAIRLDFARHEVVLVPAADAASLRGPQAIDLPVSRKNGELLVRVTVDGVVSDLHVDTGSATGVSFFSDWAIEHHLGQGRSLWRASQLDVGPISVDDSIVDVVTTRSADGDGLLGNSILARCQAVVLDAAHTRVSVEPPCTRAVPEDHLGAALTWPADGGPPKVSSVIADSPAERAGLVAGDEIESIDGRSASALSWSGWWALASRPVGTKLTLRVRRADGVTTVKVSLAPIGSR
jgi:hypothetical protein